MRKTLCDFIGIAFAIVVVGLSSPSRSFGTALLPWTDVGTLPPNVSGNYMATNGNCWYAMEGDYGSTGHLGTWYAEFQPDGTIGNWVSTSSRAIDRFSYGAVAAENHIYIIGGQMQPAQPSRPPALAVEYANINPDGSLSSWQTTSALPSAQMAEGVATYGNYVYAVGGHDSGASPLRTVEYAQIQSNGSLGAWQSATPMQKAHPYTQAIAEDGYLYVFGGGVNGYLTNTVERAQINANGSLGPWIYDTPLPTNRAGMGATVLGSSIYLTGGQSGTYGTTPLSSVIQATLNPDHTLGPWQSDTSLNRTMVNSQATTNNGHIYVSGSWQKGERSYVPPPAPPQQPRHDPLPAQPASKDLVVYTHGWQTTEAEWTDPNGSWRKLDQTLRSSVPSTWAVMGVDWTPYDGSIATGPGFALNSACEWGRILGRQIADEHYDHVHLIAHSAGSALISTAEQWIEALSPDTVIQTTYLDPYTPTSAWNTFYGSHRSKDWSDSYIAQDWTPGTQPTLANSHNVDVTWLDPNVTVNAFGIPTSSHGWPIDFYRETIPPSTIINAAGNGYPRSQEGGGWATRGDYPIGNDPPVTLGGPGTQATHTIERQDAPLDFSRISTFTSSTGTVAITGTGFNLTTGSPVWMSSNVTIAQPVNTLVLSANFIDNAGAEGLLAVYWNDHYLGQIDERYVLSGMQPYSFILPETFDAGTYSIAFRLDPYTATQSRVTIDGVSTGLVTVPEPSTLALLCAGAIGLLGYAWRRRR